MRLGLHAPQHVGGVLLVLLSVACSSTPEPSEPKTSWSAVAEPDTVVIETRDAEGETHDTTIWIVEVEGSVFIRTGDTRWYRRLSETWTARLRAAGSVHPVRARLVEDPELRAAVQERYREKYGFTDRLVGWVTFGEPRIMELRPREATR